MIWISVGLGMLLVLAVGLRGLVRALRPWFDHGGFRLPTDTTRPRRRWLLLALLLTLAGCAPGYRGPGTYPGYMDSSPGPDYYQMMLPPPMRWAPPPYPGGPIFRTQ